jgi:hypothetical protein
MSLLKSTRGGKSVDYPLNGGVLLGTAPGCQIVVADPGAAPKHCKIARSPQGFVVTDLSGGGGTVINGNKIKEHVLRDGDVLQIGSEKFVFADKQPEPAKSPAPQTPPAGGRRPLPNRAPRSAPTLKNAPTPPAGKTGQARTAAVAAPKKLTAKPGSVARVHKDHKTFTLPSTPKGKMIAISVAVGLVVVGGVLFAISANTVNSEQVKKKAAEEVAALEALPEANLQARYDKARDIATNADYLKYAGKEINPAVKMLEPLKKQLDQEKLAATNAKPFIENYKTVSEGAPEEFKKQWQALYDTVSVHLDNFERTTLGPELRRIRDSLKTNLENVGPDWTSELVGLGREVSRLIREGHFNTALIEIDKFGTKFGEKEIAQLKSKLQGERDRLKSEAKRYVEDKRKEAAEKSTKAERKKFLEDIRPFIKGFPEAEKLLDQAISEHK